MTTLHRLTDMELDFISLVPAGDDPMAKVVIAKAAPVDIDEDEDEDKKDKEESDDNTSDEKADEDTADSTEDAADADDDAEAADEDEDEEDEEEKKVKKSDSEENSNDKREEIEDITSKLSKNDLNNTEEQVDTTISKSDLPVEVVTYVEALEDETGLLYAQVEKAEADLKSKDDEITKLTAELDSVKATLPPEEVEKSAIEKADPVVRELIEKQITELAEYKEIAKAEREARLEREFIAKAQQLPMITGDSASFGALLRRASETLSPEDNEMLEGIFKAANAQITEGALFETLGSGGAEVTIEKSLESMANEIVKSNPGTTFEQAITKIYEQNPELAEAALNGED